MEKSPKVVVVGAGIAGLTTAYRLHRGGADVDLYEARGRVGGRILTATVSGRAAELGGQNIGDGGEAAHLNRLIDEFGLQCRSSRVYLKHAYFDGERLIPISEILKGRKIDPQALQRRLNELASTCSNMQEVLKGIVDPQDPLYKVLAVRMAAYEGGTVDKLAPLYRETLFHMLLGGICSVHQDTHVDLITIAGGNAALPQKMGEALGPRLHLNRPLTKVAKDKEGAFHLTFENGTEVHADIVVLAIPCSVYEHIAFEDAIPAQKLEAIQKVEYGQNAKIITPLATLPTKTTGVVGDEVVSFFDDAQQLLTIYYTGKTSLFSPKTIADSYAQARPMIEMGFGSHCLPTMLPTHAEDRLNFSYDGPVGYSWPSDPYAKGTYSYIASGQEELLTATEQQNGETFKTLFAPTQGLYFVGEHASILSDIPGTMEAACESGERIARAILQKL